MTEVSNSKRKSSSDSSDGSNHFLWKMTSVQDVEASVTIDSSSQDSFHLDDHSNSIEAL